MMQMLNIISVLLWDSMLSTKWAFSSKCEQGNKVKSFSIIAKAEFLEPTLPDFTEELWINQTSSAQKVTGKKAEANTPS